MKNPFVLKVKACPLNELWSEELADKATIHHLFAIHLITNGENAGIVFVFWFIIVHFSTVALSNFLASKLQKKPVNQTSTVKH